MAEAHDTYKIIYQNLIDAGCDENIIEKCMQFVKNGKAFDMLPILSKHRKSLLDLVHTGQKQIDCLDYLIYALKKTKINGGNQNERFYFSQSRQGVFRKKPA